VKSTGVFKKKFLRMDSDVKINVRLLTAHVVGCKMRPNPEAGDVAKV
jgi:hypothetical protein